MPDGPVQDPAKKLLSISNQRMPHSLFESLVEAPADPILGTAAAYNADSNPNKVNLGIGAYRTEEGKPYTFA